MQALTPVDMSILQAVRESRALNTRGIRRAVQAQHPAQGDEQIDTRCALLLDLNFLKKQGSQYELGDQGARLT